MEIKLRVIISIIYYSLQVSLLYSKNGLITTNLRRDMKFYQFSIGQWFIFTTLVAMLVNSREIFVEEVLAIIEIARTYLI